MHVLQLKVHNTEKKHENVQGGSKLRKLFKILLSINRLHIAKD